MSSPLKAKTGRSSKTAPVAGPAIRVADEVWIVTALLHREHPDRDDFTVSEIVERARLENLAGSLRPGVYVHASLHCVANVPPNPGRYRMLFETGRQRRRLFRAADPFHPARARSKTQPAAGEIPAEYRALLTWYRSWSEESERGRAGQDPLLALEGSGRDVWKDEDPDAYLARLREGWE